MDFFQNTDFKESNNLAVKKLMFSGHQIEQKAFIEASDTNNIHTGEKGFGSSYF